MQGFYIKYNKNPPVQLIKTKQAYWPKQRFTGPVTPCIVKFADGKVLEISLYLTTNNQ